MAREEWFDISLVWMGDQSGIPIWALLGMTLFLHSFFCTVSSVRFLDMFYVWLGGWLR